MRNSLEREITDLYTSFVFLSASASASGATSDDDCDNTSAATDKDDGMGRIMLGDGRCCREPTTEPSSRQRIQLTPTSPLSNHACFSYLKHTASDSAQLNVSFVNVLAGYEET